MTDAIGESVKTGLKSKAWKEGVFEDANVNKRGCESLVGVDRATQGRSRA